MKEQKVKKQKKRNSNLKQKVNGVYFFSAVQFTQEKTRYFNNDKPGQRVALALCIGKVVIGLFYEKLDFCEPCYRIFHNNGSTDEAPEQFLSLLSQIIIHRADYVEGRQSIRNCGLIISDK